MAKQALQVPLMEPLLPRSIVQESQVVLGAGLGDGLGDGLSGSGEGEGDSRGGSGDIPCPEPLRGEGLGLGEGLGTSGDGLGLATSGDGLGVSGEGEGTGTPCPPPELGLGLGEGLDTSGDGLGDGIRLGLGWPGTLYTATKVTAPSSCSVMLASVEVLMMSSVVALYTSQRTKVTPDGGTCVRT